VKYREKWCLACKHFIPKKGASSPKCGFKDVVFIDESKIRCPWFDHMTFWSDTDGSIPNYEKPNEAVRE